MTCLLCDRGGKGAHLRNCPLWKPPKPAADPAQSAPIPPGKEAKASDVIFDESFSKVAAQSALAAQKWVKVSERMPDPEHTVLWCKVPIQEPPVIGSLMDVDFDYSEYFTHWMAMPNEFWPTDTVAAQTPEEK